MTCDQFAGLIEIYALGSLDNADSESLRAHLDSGCPQCGSQIDQALAQAALISATVPLVEPPASLRSRITASVQNAVPVVVMPVKKKPSSFVPWLLAAAAVAALALGIVFEENARRTEVRALSATLRQSDGNAQRMAQMLNILEAPGTKQVAFNITQSNLPHGSLFIHKNLGVAMVVANLPSAPAGWKYQSWVVPKSGAPRPVEAFATDPAGFAVTVVKGPVDVTQWDAMAVSLEPENTNPVKPSKLLFACPV